MTDTIHKSIFASYTLPELFRIRDAVKILVDLDVSKIIDTHLLEDCERQISIKMKGGEHNENHRHTENHAAERE